jgi:ribonuclease HI
MTNEDIVIYTDGGCIHNPGPGGYAAVLISGGKFKEISGGFRLTTNNRMELTAAIEALKSLSAQGIITLYSDSRYMVDSINLGWAKQWRTKGWRKADRRKAENIDLWRVLLDLYDKMNIRFIWVEGHSGNRWNERCDKLAVQAAKQKDLPVDPGYEQPAQLF